MVLFSISFFAFTHNIVHDHGISKIYGSYSASASQAATGGTVELTGKIIGASDAATDVELIGGYNSAGGSVGSNTLNVSGAAAGSKIKAVSSFDTINFSLPDTEATTLLTATGTVDIDGAKITLDKAPAYSLTLLDAGTLNGTAGSYWIGTEDVTSKTSGDPYHNVIADSSNQRIEVTSGWFATDSTKLIWTVDKDNSFYTGIYYPSGGGEAVHAEDNKVVLNTTPNVKYVYGSYSEDVSKAAENGTVELAGKITSADLNLVGGKNLAGGTVGSNTLNVKAAVTGSTVYNIQGFKEIDFVVPETATDPILQANHISGLVADKIKLDKAPTCDLTILKVDTLEIEKIGTQFFFGDTNVSTFTSSGNEYHAATANDAKYRVEVTSGYWNNTNTTIAWKNTEAFYTGIYTDSTGNVTKVTDNIVQLDSVPQDGVTKVYGSYSAKNDVAATGGTVALAGKITGASDTVANVELIGGYNSAGGSGGNNTLSILASAAESKVNKIENFTELDFYVPDKVISGAMLTVTTADNIAGAKIWLEAAPAFDMTLLTAGNDIPTGTTYWIGDTQLTGGDPNKYPYFNVTNNTTNILVSKGYIDTTTATAIKWTNEDSILTGKYTDEDGNTTSSDGGTIVINNNLNIPAGVTKIYGSYSAKNEVEATGGTVALADGIANSTLELIGGYNSAGVTFSDNTLKVLANAFRSKVKSISAFDKIDFTLPQGIKNGDTVLNTTNITYNDATIDVSAAAGVKLNKDDVIYLVKSETAPTGTIGNDGAAVLGGVATVSINGNDLILTLLQDFEQKKSAGSEDQQKAPVEGMAAAVQTVNMSADLASGQGMASLVANTADGTTNTFGAMSSGQSKYKTGSHVDIKGWGMLVGVGKTKEWGNGEATTLGVFFEYGKGDFDTYNGDVHGDGNSKNQGIGIMMRHKMLNNTYYEGNIRYGKQKTEWSESELGSYDTDSKYYGIMVGMGHIFPAGKNAIDVYGRYTYGHVGACDAKLNTTEYHFDSVKSHRVRLGAKYNFVQEKSNAKPFIGLAWEHEFKGESKASISGVGEAPAPSMKGNVGIFELGCDWDVSKKWTLGLGANAYIGKRKGWDGTARVFYNF